MPFKQHSIQMSTAPCFGSSSASKLPDTEHILLKRFRFGYIHENGVLSVTLGGSSKSGKPDFELPCSETADARAAGLCVAAKFGITLHTYGEQSVKVMKFGGSSVRDAERIEAVCGVVGEAAQDERLVVVCSAMKGVTDDLIAYAEHAETGSVQWKRSVGGMRARHERTAQMLLDSAEADAYTAELTGLIEALSNVLQGIQLIKECSRRSMDLVMSFGERMSCTLIARALARRGTEATYYDPREMIVTDTRFGNATVDLEQSYTRIRARIGRDDSVPVIPGFIAGSPDGATTTLGRNGSDYTASIIGAALDADRIEIWTDVDGVLSADPRTVPAAFVIPEISYEEAMEMSYFGAEVLHPSTMIPAVGRNIPIVIRNTLNPAAPGTRIAATVAPHTRMITGIASIEDVSLINVEGGGMLGLPGVASSVFQALARAEINIIMISQASSEHSICVVCRSAEAGRAVEALKTQLTREIETNTIQNIDMIPDLEIIAVIGENMRGKPGMSGRLFSSLGAEGVNVLAIAQGSSERNISFVIRRTDRERALRTVHRAFLE